MKKLLFAVLSLVLVVGMAVGCGGSGNNGSRGDDNALENAKVVGDIYNLVDDDDVRGSSLGNNHYVMVFEFNGSSYRIWTNVSDEIMRKYFDIDFFAEDREEQEKALLKDLPIEELTNLTEKMPTQDEVNKYVGKTGQELIDMGFSCHGFSFWDDTLFYLGLGDYDYEAVMNEKMDDYDEDAEYEEILAPLTVKSIKCTGVGMGAVDIFNDYE